MTRPGGDADWAWEDGQDAAELHELLVRSDAYQAGRTGTAAPARRIETTRALVSRGSVHVLRHGGQAVASFTLSCSPPSGLDPSAFPAAGDPVYLSRLAVLPELLAEGSFAGVRCVRRAIRLATAAGADALRAEANPDLTDTRTMLLGLGFEQQGPVHADETGRRYVHLQKLLRQ
ncbi:hypothetical protein [Nonomuraea gerenzanensis]|uniref:N-acetyltransferase domain-containing protein n=1 Tax=Nonomuraea gerenzanensis TaxID=93944 RepID=A0A1M4ELV5_9ACTN|nr:hypothetical protein [Nonomuraea gerenzanensis]UBU11334.1 hypothetical protein LCN96_44630 [Nonomuraea gerenzanensis]SBO99812.1 hypothetical protein BN4615_P9328 [Nonomuraea gerenzanensis]